MKLKTLRPDLKKFLRKRNLAKKFSKQAKIFSNNPHHPSLKTEVLEPKHLRLYSFRIDKKYRAIFIITPDNKAEVIDINCHYQ